MIAPHGRATSPDEAFWALDPRVLIRPGAPWLVEIERQVPREQHELLDRLARERGPSMREPDLAPVISVRRQGDAHDVVRAEAVALIERTLHAWVALPAVFDDPAACMRALARWSGGHVRHLLQIARRAVEDTAPERVTVANIETAGRSLGVRLIARLRPEDVPRARELHCSHQLIDTEQDRRMLEAACVLTYCGASVWWDVHPAIWADELFQAAQ